MPEKCNKKMNPNMQHRNKSNTKMYNGEWANSHHFCRSNSIRQCLTAEKSALSLNWVSACIKQSRHFLFRSVVMPSIVETCPSKNILFPIVVSLRLQSLASTCHHSRLEIKTYQKYGENYKQWRESKQTISFWRRMQSVTRVVISAISFSASDLDCSCTNQSNI